MHLKAAEEKEDSLAKQVRKATFNHVVAQLDHDLDIVEEKVMETKESQAMESAKDAKFLRERQMILDLVRKSISGICQRFHQAFLCPLCLIFWVLIFEFAYAPYSVPGKLLHGSRTGCLQSVSSSKPLTRWQVAWTNSRPSVRSFMEQLENSYLPTSWFGQSYLS